MPDIYKYVGFSSMVHPSSLLMVEGLDLFGFKMEVLVPVVAPQLDLFYTVSNLGNRIKIFHKQKYSLN